MTLSPSPIQLPIDAEAETISGAAIGIGFAPNSAFITSCNTIASPKVTKICSACGLL